MTTPKPDEESIFKAARRLAAGETRQAYLDQVCGGDAALRGRVQELLRVDEEEQSFLAAPALGPTVTADQPVAEVPGSAIGPYKLLEQIGEGGFGVVFLAEQAQPVRRKVALKVLKPGMDTRQVVARFEAERQALALMDHPNIAKVLDAGTTPSGRPYFVMELVKGTPITRYCDDHKLTPRQRLELFVQVCAAVQHAHQKGIIHRDIKPSNILVAPYDGTPVVKVIDFGVAKATGRPLTEQTLHTGFGAVVGTLEYMSPEQAELNNADIDTRSDIYSLGVLLYELLTGTTPLERERVKGTGLLEALRIVREEEVPTLDNRLGATEELSAIAAARGLEPMKLRRLVRGELDWIVRKALEKDRSRRYETANGFAADVRRYLADEPVLACTPTAGYRLRKFVRQNRGVVMATAVVVLAGLIAVAGLAVGYRDTQAALDVERQANESLEEAREKDRRQLYELRLSLARQNWLAGDLDPAKQHLQECPTDLRDGGWRYLHRVCHAELRHLVLDPEKHTAGGSVALSPDGRWLAASGSRATIRRPAITIWDLTAGAEPFTVEMDAVDVSEIAFSEDGRELRAKVFPLSKPDERAVGLIHGAEVIAWDVPAFKQKRDVHLLRKPHKSIFTAYTSALSAYGTHLAVADQGELSICDAVTGKELFRPQLPDDAFKPRDILCRPDGHGLAFIANAAGRPSRIMLWDSTAGWSEFQLNPKLPLRGPLKFSPDGRWLAVTGHDRARTKSEILIWNLRLGREVTTIRGPQSWVAYLAFSHDGRRLASGSHDNTVIVWDVATGREVLTLRGHTREIGTLVFSYDGNRLASRSEDYTVRVWDTSPLEAKN